MLDTGVLSFLQNSSFLNQHLTVDFSTKISYLDIILLNSANFTNSVLVLYNSYIYDLYNLFSFTALPVLTLFFSSYQDVYGVTLLVSPEVIMAHLDYFTLYHFLTDFNTCVSFCFDSYTNNLNYIFGEGLLSFFMFIFFS